MVLKRLDARFLGQRYSFFLHIQIWAEGQSVFAILYVFVSYFSKLL